MLHDLLTKYDLYKMKRKEIIDLLGEPDCGSRTLKEYPKEWGNPNWHKDAVLQDGYGIGNHSGARIDPDVFHIYYDKKGNVVDIKVIQY